MLEQVHEHVIQELQQNSKTDTVFVVAAVVFNLVVLGINWGVAGGQANAERPPQNDVILGLLFGATLLINGFSIRALVTGAQTRKTLLSGLVAMYKDHDVDKYYDPAVLDAYGTRYRLFGAVLLILALISIVVPLLERTKG
jgi:hypothetical protein